MCWVSLMTLEFFERGFLKPSHIWKDTRVLVEKYKTEEWIICKKDFYFRRWEWIMTHLRSSPLSLSLSRSTATCAKLKFLSGCDMIGLLIRNETKPNLSLSLFQGWRCPGVAAGSINRPVKKCLALGPAINHLWLMMTDFLFKAPCLSCGIELQTRQVFRLEDIKSSNILGRLRGHQGVYYRDIKKWDDGSSPWCLSCRCFIFLQKDLLSCSILTQVVEILQECILVFLKVNCLLCLLKICNWWFSSSLKLKSSTLQPSRISKFLSRHVLKH